MEIVTSQMGTVCLSGPEGVVREAPIKYIFVFLYIYDAYIIDFPGGSDHKESLS